MRFVCFGRDEVEEESRRSLEALALRKRAEDERGNGNYCEAHRLLSQGYISKGDAFMALDQVDAAEKSYSMALEIDPSIRHSKSFKLFSLEVKNDDCAASPATKTKSSSC
ncbi:uncharacterized protein LOC107864509 isoform X1 [Capsicum annuum]|uniref:uncharacterized protein LOC107864509 isoform X1 n=1 Tax=Capsicum annuum TaxID=4072 RepID=UPI001FB189E0|nr:uncharacterized protein LOC107864509 isoform X1 [Capsicum annuum]